MPFHVYSSYYPQESFNVRVEIEIVSFNDDPKEFCPYSRNLPAVQSLHNCVLNKGGPCLSHFFDELRRFFPFLETHHKPNV